jgi:DNA-binding SARP family transcriptional activator
VSVAIVLLGKPRIERDAAPMPPPRGHKSWGLLAYLVLAERQPTRTHLASLLFAKADDPLGALRWNLAELRRVLGDPLVLRGDPPALRLPHGTVVDVRDLLRGAGAATGFADWQGDLLEGIHFPECPEFDLWLGYQRRQIMGVYQAIVHEAALARLAADDAGGAIDLAARLVAVEPLEARSQELLIRCLARSGDRRRAEQQLLACEQLFERDLGMRPGPEIRAAAREGNPVAALGDRAAALGQLEAGRAAIDAGAVEPGLECLRLASAEAAASGDVALHARSLSELGSALVHAVRGRDQEGAAVLHEALVSAERAGEQATAAMACRELGYIDVQAGRGHSAMRWLAKATELSTTDEERCAILGVRGMALSDRADYRPALQLLEESAAIATSCGRSQQVAWSLSLIGRIYLLRDEFDEAIAALDRCLDLVAAERWTAFRPWPEALRAEALLRAGRWDSSSGRLDSAFRLACQLGDPCWEATAARVIGLQRAAEGDTGAAREWLAQARARVTRVSDPYEWVHAQVLETMAGLAIEADDHDAGTIIRDLQQLAERAEMREFVVRALLHNARLAVPGAHQAAQLLAAEIDNPAFQRLLGSPAST